VILVDVLDVMRIHDARTELSDALFDRSDDFEQRQRVQALIGKTAEPNMMDALHPARVLGASLLEVGLIVPGANAVARQAHPTLRRRARRAVRSSRLR
jgi:hypothetical protein